MPDKTHNQLLEELLVLATAQANHQHDANIPISASDTSRVIEMAWEDRTPFEAIQYQFNLDESQVIEVMRLNLHPKSFKLWRQRVTGRITKHVSLRPEGVSRAYCPTQYKQK